MLGFHNKSSKNINTSNKGITGLDSLIGLVSIGLILICFFFILSRYII